MLSRTVLAEERLVPQQHATIQAAIDAAAVGDTVLVSAGRYPASLKFKPGVHVRSAGDDTVGKQGLLRAEQTILDGSLVPEGIAPGIQLAAGATLDGFTVTNVGKYDEARWQQDHTTQGEHQPHEHIGLFGIPAIAIDGTTCTVRHNIVHHNGDTGIGIQGGEGTSCSPLVAHNICYRNMGGGIGSMRGSTALIQNNTCFENYYAGIGHSGASPFVLNNVCYGNIRAGIGISEGACPIVRGNRCYHNRRAGIGIRTGAETAPVVEGNECYENEMAGIGCEEHARPIVRNNHCHHNKLVGIGAQEGAEPLLVGNRCEENQLAGIGLRDGAHGVLVENTSTRNKTAGIGIEEDAHGILLQNRCEENRLVAIGIPSGGEAYLHGNHCSRTGGMPPLVALRSGAKAVLTQNQFQGGGVAAVLIEGEVTLCDNEFIGQGPKQGTAVWVWKGSSVQLHANHFADYRKALGAAESSVSASENIITGFQQTAIQVQRPSSPAHVFGNRAYSTEAKAQCAAVDEPHGIVAQNTVESPAANGEPDSDPASPRQP
ncbi:MAG: right-handed parallel beta-helix repeat-containing protein [Planctomycetaceae bacterium]|nr:right-handed parallel beta-helix repeat-containing protein [Planctomycetaceae bacterium]